MTTFTLIIGNKAYSSWSLRPWLALKQARIAFVEKRIALFTPEGAGLLQDLSPSGKVPVLLDGTLPIWDSLAICEYASESFPDRHMWPSDRAARAVARSISAEMHSGFGNLRENMTMNCRKSYPGIGRAPGVQEDIDRITQIWRDCRSRFGAKGNMLFGDFSIADAMFAPVATRFVTYGVPLDPVCQAYVDAIYALPAMQQWLAEARTETEIIEIYEH